jgi:KDO2-lipid IV(A) lauroyltransferase
MTLAMKLAHQTQATVLMGWCQRLPGGRFRGHFCPMQAYLQKNNSNAPSDHSDHSAGAGFDVTQATQAMNQAMEQMILANASQYLWGYDRFKKPREGVLSQTSSQVSKQVTKQVTKQESEQGSKQAFKDRH